MSKSTNIVYLNIKAARMKVRKATRKDKRRQNKLVNFNSATWEGPDGRMMQNCDYFGTCEFPCNGDC